MKEQVSYLNNHQNVGHHCRNLVIRCMDFRFVPYLDDLLNEMFLDEGGLGDYDSPGVGGGGSKSIIDPVSQKAVFGALEIAIAKHQVCRVIIIDHIDCGAYGGSGEHKDEKAEEKFHVEKLAEAKKILEQKYSELQIITLYQNWQELKKV